MMGKKQERTPRRGGHDKLESRYSEEIEKARKVAREEISRTVGLQGDELGQQSIPMIFTEYYVILIS